MWANESTDMYIPPVGTVVDVICRYNTSNGNEHLEITRHDEEPIWHNYGTFNNSSIQKVATGKITGITQNDENGHYRYQIRRHLKK